jgi:hypothetical protein
MRRRDGVESEELPVSVFRPVHGDLVHLTAECRSARTGRVYEIGTRALVIGARSGELTLEVGGPAERDAVRCSAENVSLDRAPRPRQVTPWYRRRPRLGAA